MTRRDGEKESIRFRSDRFVCINGKWFFTTRESTQPIGPFSSRATAAREIERYKVALQKNPNPTLTHRHYDGIVK